MRYGRGDAVYATARFFRRSRLDAEGTGGKGIGGAARRPNAMTRTHSKTYSANAWPRSVDAACDAVAWLLVDQGEVAVEGARLERAGTLGSVYAVGVRRDGRAADVRALVNRTPAGWQVTIHTEVRA